MVELLEWIVDDSQPSKCYFRKLAEAYALFFSALSMKLQSNGETPVENPWQNHLLNLILSDANPFSQQSELSPPRNLGISLIQQVEEDLRKLHQLYLLDSVQMLSALRPVSPENLWVSWDQFHGLRQNRVLIVKPCRIEAALSSDNKLGLLCGSSGEFYSSTGSDFQSIQSLSLEAHASGASLEGIESIDPIRLEDLVGCDDQKDWLVRNTTHFLAGLPANNVFVYGDRGTGKSSAIKALLHHFSDKPLRMLEISREDLSDLPEVMKRLRSRREYFIVFIDDLSFEEGETKYKTLKAMLEGGLSLVLSMF